MKRMSWIVLLLAAVTAGSVAFSVACYRSCRTTERPLQDRLRDIAFLTRRLNLDPAQAQAMTLLQSGYSRRLTGCCSRNCEARRQLAKALASGDRDAYGSIIAEMCKTYEESERITLDHIEKVRNLLDTVQRETFDTLISGCLCRACEKPRKSACGGTQE